MYPDPAIKDKNEIAQNQFYNDRLCNQVSRYDVNEDNASNNNKISKKTVTVFLGACISVFLLIIIMIIIAVGFGKNLFFSSNNNITDDGKASNDSYPLLDSSQRADRLREYLITVIFNGAETFNDPVSSSPELQALRWMQHEDPMKLDPSTSTEDLENLFLIEERFALLTLWFQSEFDWYDQTNWLTGGYCSWKGITCDAKKSVTRINLEKNYITGTIPADLALLKNLISLNLSNNQLKGKITESFSLMKRLEELFLDHNNFSEEIAFDLSLMPNLAKLDLSYNRLEGAIPDSLHRTTSINEIRLDNNDFTCSISDNIGNLINLGKNFEKICFPDIDILFVSFLISSFILRNCESGFYG